MKHYTYLFIDLAAILIPFIFSFHPKIKFYSKWVYAFPALIITAVVFIIWDSYFTSIGIWKFNPGYITGNYLFLLPIEEILFFICIPYACLFTYFCIAKWTQHRKQPSSIFIITLLIFLFSTGIYYYHLLYTTVTFLFLFLLVGYLTVFKKVNWLGTFFIAAALLLVPFLICNGILTGYGIHQPVVIYNNSENMNIRILTIPLEDIFYGMLMILLNVTLFHFFSAKGNRVKEDRMIRSR